MKTVAFYNPIDVIIIITMTKEIFNEGQNNFCCNGIVSMDRANNLKFQKIINAKHWFSHLFRVVNELPLPEYMNEGKFI